MTIIPDAGPRGGAGEDEEEELDNLMEVDQKEDK